MVFLILLSLLLSLSLGLYHVGLILVLLKLILEDTSLDVLEGLPSRLFLSDTVVTNHVYKHDAGVNDLFLLLEKGHDTLAKLISFASLTIREHQFRQSCNQQLNASES